MRDFQGLNAALVPSTTEDLERYLPVLRRDLGHLDYFLRDLSRGIQRIEVGQVPDGSGNTIINQVISDLYWYKPGMPSGTHLAYGSQAPAGSATIGSTAHTTKGFIYLGSSSGLAFDETNTRVGLNQGTPTARLHMVVPAGPSYTAPSAAAVIAGTSWSAQPSGTLLAALNDRDTDPTGTDYARWTASLGNGQIQIDWPVMADPGVGVLFGFKVLLRASAGCQTRLSFDYGFGGTIVSSAIMWGGESNVSFPSGWQANVTTSFVEYSFTMNATDSATMRAGVAAGGAPRILVANSGNVGTETFDVGYCSISVTSAGSVETLQKWATSGSILDQLDFADDGAAGTDLKLSGNSELFVNVGDASSGLRFYALSSTAYIEAGTTAQAAMNLILGGNRASTGTLLTSNFTNTRLAGALQLNGATSGRLTMQAAAITTDHTLTWPAAQPGSASFLSNTAGVLSWTASSGFAASTEPYVVMSATAGLSAERVLTGTANQIIRTDNGANSTVVLSTPQNLDTGTTFQVGILGIGAAAAAGLELDVTGEATFRSTVNIITTTDIDTLVLHYRSSVLAIPGKPFRAIDDDGGAPEFYIDGSTGYMVGGGFALGTSGGSSGFRSIHVATALSADRTITWPNLTGIPQLLSGTQTSSAIMTWSGVQTFSSVTRPLFKAGITIEDPGAGTNTIAVIAPTAPTSHTLTLPGANAAGALQNNGSGTLSWSYAFSDATFNLFQAGTPTAQLFWNLAAISGGSSRTWTVQDWSGNPVVPSSNGTSGQVLTSQGAGTQPIWGAAAAASDPAYSPGSFTVATETARLQPRHLKLTTTQRATLAGTATLRMT